MVECLICANDWLRGDGGKYVSVEEDTEQMALLEEGNIFLIASNMLPRFIHSTVLT
jgi:hypothetical protein